MASTNIIITLLTNQIFTSLISTWAKNVNKIKNFYPITSFFIMLTNKNKKLDKLKICQISINLCKKIEILGGISWSIGKIRGLRSIWRMNLFLRGSMIGQVFWPNGMRLLLWLQNFLKAVGQFQTSRQSKLKWQVWKILWLGVRIRTL